MIELIPAIDLIDGKCVRLSQGEYDSKKIYNENPVEVAKAFEAHGLKRLHVVDLDGAASKHVVNYRTLEQLAGHTSLVIDFGGGIKTDDDMRIVFESGAQMATIGSVAAKEPELFRRWMDTYGSARIILGADAKNGKIAVSGWKEESGQELMSFIGRYVEEGVTQVLCTDISRDGMLQGPATELYGKIMKAHPDLNLIASGGVSGIDDILELEENGIPAVVVGKAFYEGRIPLDLLTQFIS